MTELVDHPVDGRRRGHWVGEDVLPLGEDQVGRDAQGPAFVAFGDERETVKHSVKEYVNGMAHTNGIESVWAVLKRGYNGVYHHWDFKHMARYVDEFTFRLNEGNVKRPTLERLGSLVKGAVGKRLTYQSLIAE